MSIIKNQTAFIQKRFGDVFLTWFKNSKTFVLLRQPANDVFQRFIKGIHTSEIIDYCKENYSQVEENIPQFVDDIIGNINILNQSNSDEPALPNKLSFKNSFRTKYIKNYYLFGDQHVLFKYSTPYLKELVHPLFSHLQTTNKKKPDYQIELVEVNEQLVFKCNKNIIEIYSSQEAEYFKGAILKYLYSILYKKDYNSWMMTLHASGVEYNNEAVLFSASAGSGKSTLSAILQANGYQLLSDDFIAADEKANVYPFPSAISVKEGSVDVLSAYYPELTNGPTYIASTGKQVRYIENNNPINSSYSGSRVKAIVFVKFKTDVECQCKLVDRSDAIPLLLNEIWVQPKANNINRFFEWLNTCAFYELEYSDHRDALGCVAKIFKS